MRYFVTGGAGFIGSHIVDRLVNEGHEVTVYDNLSTGKIEYLANHQASGKIKFICADLCDAKKLREVVGGHDFVYHFAANPDIRLAETEPEVDFRNGIIATYNVLDAMRLNNVKKLVFASSSVVYGEAVQIPTPEDYGPLLPISLYGGTKLGAEGLITAYCHTFGIQAWIFRFANVIGHRCSHGVLVDFINKLKRNPTELEILGDGRQKKAYLLVEDCVDAMFYAVAHSDEEVNVFNVGYEDQVTVTRIAELVVETLGLHNVKFRYTGGERGWKGDVRSMLLDVSKLRALGWKPKYSSEGAVREALKILKSELLDRC
jgi:UDP-glucose 4-epimerase